MVTDEPTPDAFAIGKNTLVFFRALYETATENELAAVIAHELGHFHHSDNHKLGIALKVLNYCFFSKCGGFISLVGEQD